jgi:hypothetical protein
MVFEVTQEMIDTGRQGHPVACPIALSVSAKIPEKKISVGTTHLFTYDVHLGNLTAGVEFELPEAAIKFRETFDRYGASRVKPILFEVEGL